MSVAKFPGKPAPKRKHTHVMASVRIDVSTYAKISALAALEGVDKSALMCRFITEGVSGIVVFDRRKSEGGANPSCQETSTDAA